jgi:GNAT superfamily N-acetyltransferase
MVLLDKKDYEKASIALQVVTINKLFARAVVEQKVSGQIYVDDKHNPASFYIIHPYGMTLLFGDSNNKTFNDQFKKYALNIDNDRDFHEWMQVFPIFWDNVLSELFESCLIKSENNINKQETGIIELNTRLNFLFNKQKYLARHKPIDNPDIEIVKTDREMFRKMKGSVIPANFWENEDHFFANGIAYSLFYKGQLASTAFSSCWFDNQFELGIETEPEFRGKGFAELVCSALIKYCIQHDYEPIWACRRENTGSYKLAIKLGFEVSALLSYYRLSK